MKLAGMCPSPLTLIHVSRRKIHLHLDSASMLQIYIHTGEILNDDSFSPKMVEDPSDCAKSKCFFSVNI